MGPSHLPRMALDVVAMVSSPDITDLIITLEALLYIPAKLLDTRTLLPEFSPSSTPTTRFRVPFAVRP